MFKIEFLKDDKVGGKVVEKGAVVSVSRSIREKKVSDGIAKDAEALVETPKKKGK